MFVVLRLRGAFVFRRGGGADGEVNIKHPSSRKAVALDTIPSPQCGRRNAEIVGYGFKRLALSDSIDREVLRVGFHIAAGVFAGSEGEDQLRAGVEVGAGVELIGVCNRLDRGV